MSWAALSSVMAGMTETLAILCLVVIIWRIYIILPTYLLARKGEWVPKSDPESITKRNKTYVLNVHVLAGFCIGLIGVILHTVLAMIWIRRPYDTWPHDLTVLARLFQNLGALVIIRSISYEVCREWGWLTMGIFGLFIGAVIGLRV